MVNELVEASVYNVRHFNRLDDRTLFSAGANLRITRNYVKSTGAQTFHQILMQGGRIKVKIQDADCSATAYNFTITNAD